MEIFLIHILISKSIFKNIKITACADIIQELSDKKASKYNIKSFNVDDLFKNKDIDIILNLTIPSAHKEIIIKSLENGKHCFSEKPLAINFKEGLEIQKISNEKKLIVGCAPDTFLGAAGQKARSLIENEELGKIVLEHLILCLMEWKIGILIQIFSLNLVLDQYLI